MSDHKTTAAPAHDLYETYTYAPRLRGRLVRPRPGGGLTSASGGMVAAATMSLPERARQGRNYDYRYAWIRDQCIAGQAFAPPFPGLWRLPQFPFGRLSRDFARTKLHLAS